MWFTTQWSVGESNCGRTLWKLPGVRLLLFKLFLFASASSRWLGRDGVRHQNVEFDITWRALLDFFVGDYIIEHFKILFCPNHTVLCNIVSTQVFLRCTRRICIGLVAEIEGWNMATPTTNLSKGVPMNAAHSRNAERETRRPASEGCVTNDIVDASVVIDERSLKRSNDLRIWATTNPHNFEAPTRSRELIII